MAQSFSRLAPEIIENDYLVLGTMEKKVWLQGVKGDSQRFEEILEHIADFKKIYDLTVDPGRLVSSGCVKPNTITPLTIHKIFHRNQKYGFNFSLLTNPSTIPIISTLVR